MLQHIGFVLFSLCLATLVGTASHASHPFHVCVAQMEWNASNQLWEVSIRLHPQDLERVLSQSQGKPISIEDRDFADAVLPFLSKQFAIVHAPNSIAIPDLLTAMDRDKPSLAQSELRWVGMEPERGWLWIHLEMIPPNNIASDHPAWLVHRIFLDTIDRQENSVRIIHGTSRYSLQFQRSKEAQAMKTDTVASKD